MQQGDIGILSVDYIVGKFVLIGHDSRAMIRIYTTEAIRMNHMIIRQHNNM